MKHEVHRAQATFPHTRPRERLLACPRKEHRVAVATYYKGVAVMRRTLICALLALFSVLMIPLAGNAAPSTEFKAQFQDDDCTTHAQCGTGLVEGYGHVTTTLDITGASFDPATGCLIDVTAVRNLALVDDPSSTLALALSNGVICANKGSASFTIIGGTGVFTGLIVLPGTVRVTLIPGVPGDSAQYRAMIAS